MSASWRSAVRKIQDDVDAVDAASTNRPLDDLEERTDYLKQRLDSITAGRRLVDYGVSLGADVEAGHVVYHSPTTGGYERALARWASGFGPNGELVAAASARAVGVVEKLSSPGTGDLTLAGVVELTDAMTLNLFGSASPSAGLYYLSGDTAGSVTSSAPSTPIAVVVYDGSGKIKLLMDVEPNHSHIHKRYDITGGSWLDVSDSQFDSYDVPAGAELGYDRDSDSSLDDLFATYVSDAVVISNGSVRGSSEYVVNQNNVWKMTAGVPTASIEIHATSPLSFGQSIVRAVTTDTPDSLSVSALNGVVTLNLGDWEEAADSPESSAYAISALSDRKFKRTPVITNVVPGSGMTVSVNSYGVALVSLSELSGRLERPVSVDFNNAMHVTDGDVPLLSFPEDRASSMVGAIPIGGLSSGVTYEAVVFVEPAGLLGGGSWPMMSVSMTFLPSAADAVVDVGSDVTTQAASVASFASTQGKKYYKEAGDTLTVTANGILYVRLTVASSSKNKNIYGFGVRLIPQT